MANFDYAPILAVAQRLISEFGGDFTLVSYDGSAADPSKPWDGPTDPRAGAATTLAVRAVQVEPSSATKLGIAATAEDLLKRAEKVLIVAGDAVNDLGLYQEVESAAGSFKIGLVHELNPTGSNRLLWFLELSR